MGLATLDWREVVQLIAGIIALYLAFMVLRLVKVGKRTSAQSRSAGAESEHIAQRASPVGTIDAMIDLSQQIPPGVLPLSSPPSRDAIEPTAHEWSTARFAAAGATAWASERPAPANDTAADFAQQLQRSSVEVDIQQLRRESAALREEVAHLREELSIIKAARNVSPLYSEAMSLAQNGVTADNIAGQCGISLAEAELVAALARGEAEDEPYPSAEESNDGYPDPRSRTGTHG
jgi:hypothetical protein